jgi:hypothetical protein
MDAHHERAEKNRSLEDAQKAREVGSEIIRANINYRDIRQRMDAIRKLVDELMQKK